MGTLFFFGRVIERYFGAKRLFTLYFMSILGAAGFTMYQNNQLPYNRLTLGASGAVNGVITYFIC